MTNSAQWGRVGENINLFNLVGPKTTKLADKFSFFSSSTLACDDKIVSKVSFGRYFIDK